MHFRIADTFADGLGRLSGDEQKAAKTTAFDLQLNPANPGIQFRKLDRARDKNFWSVRVGSDLRIIVHRSDDSMLLCYVDHHDAAYRWAERRKLETHPKTGAAQLVEIRETVREIEIPKYVEAARTGKSTPPLFTAISQEELLSYGVPAEWIADVQAATEDSLLELADHLPSEAAEALLNLATGVQPEVAQPVTAGTDPFAHPDAQRRFRVMANVEELERALEYPWEKWTVFLHPAQRQLVERNYGGPARVSGSAGTGKTIVALHRAVHLARNNPDSRVLLATFSETLANALRTKLRRLIGNQPRVAERLEVHSLDAFAMRLHELHFGPTKEASREAVGAILSEAATTTRDHKFSQRFLMMEWEQIVDAWQLDTWEDYRDVPRLGRKTRLSEKHRRTLWSIFEDVQRQLAQQKLTTFPAIYDRLTEHLKQARNPTFDFAVVDEAQDINIPQLKFLAVLGGSRPNSLFFAGDLGQRIFQQPFSWKAMGVDVRGRSRTLKINYRTSHQIRMKADNLLAPEISDIDGNAESRRGTVSVFNGPLPEILICESPEEEIEAVGLWIKDRVAKGTAAHEIGIFVRSDGQLDRARAAVQKTGVPLKLLDETVETTGGYASIGTMHLAKGLEFRAVAVMACDDEILPLQQRIEMVTDDADLEEIYETERHLLYVACTRARDHLLVTSGGVPSEFLDDLLG